MQGSERNANRVCQHAATEPHCISLHIVGDHLDINWLRLQNITLSKFRTVHHTVTITDSE